MASKTAVKVAQQLLDRFFRDAEGRTNRQIDVYFTLQDMGIQRDKSDPALSFLTSRGLINMFGPDIAYLTDKGAGVVIEDKDIADLPKEIRDFIQKPIPPQAPPPSGQVPQPEPEPAPARPDVAQLTHVDPDGREYTLTLGRLCTIGRAPGNDIQVNDQRASKRHAELRWNDANRTFSLVDLGSANGTLLNGEYVDESVLQNDDELVIGRTMLIYQCPEEIPRPEKEETNPQTEEAGTEVAPAYEGAPTDLPPKSETEPEPIRVVKGTPTQPEPSPSQDAAADLFAPEPEAPSLKMEASPEDLFAEEPTPPSPRRAPTPHPTDDLFSASKPATAGDLFAEKTPPKEQDLFDPEAPPTGDLFGAEPEKTAQQDDLFIPGPEDEATIGASTPGLDNLSPDMTVEVPSGGSFGADFRSIEPIQPIEPLEPIEPIEPMGMEPMGSDEATINSAPASEMMEPPTIDVGRTEEEWDGPTGDDLLQNKPVVEENDKDAATVMMTRDDLVEEPKAGSELPRWGEEDKEPLGSHPEFAAASAPIDGESLPLATHSLVNLQAPTEADLAEALAEQSRKKAGSNPFYQTLAALRAQAQNADLPDREALLSAIELLEGHAYVRVVLQKIDPDR